MMDIFIRKMKDHKMKAAPQTSENFIRKQYLIEPEQIIKIKRLANLEKKSAAAIVRNAIDAYDPAKDKISDLEESDLLAFALEQVIEAREATKATIKQLRKSRKLRTSENE